MGTNGETEVKEATAHPEGAAVWIRGPIEPVQWMFQFDVDASPLDRLVSGSPLEPLHHAYRGFKPVTMLDPFQGMSWVIIGQQVNVTFASKLKRVLVEQFGEPVEVDGKIYRIFPSPERIASLRPEDLRPFQFSRQKAQYLIDLARKLASGWDLTPFYHMEVEEAIERLTQLRGVGRWSAECFLLFVFRHPDVFPSADMGLRRALGLLLGLGRNATEAEVRAFGALFPGWRSYVAQYLWLALREGRLGAGMASGARHSYDGGSVL
ncbi:MAG: DNA-3-methyladenine glycosylase 2 family protein [Alicyclobacillaceae bacterium]|nr:DNA-3-methyladenine glycosylase 2 family protein [Alicyclobacillaceae bacterium]